MLQWAQRHRGTKIFLTGLTGLTGFLFRLRRKFGQVRDLSKYCFMLIGQARCPVPTIIDVDKYNPY